MKPIDRCWLDSETRSSNPIRKGVHVYVDASDAQVMIVTWARNDGPVHIWDIMTQPTIPPQLVKDLTECQQIEACNSEFDRTMLEAEDWYRKLGISIEKWQCAQAVARAHSLPGRLAQTCAIMTVGDAFAKDKRGDELIQLFCIPRKEDGGYNDWRSHPFEWVEFCDYAKQDIVAMREVRRKLPDWNETPREHYLYTIDQKINRRGFLVDTELATAAIAAVKAAQKESSDKVLALTDGAVERVTQRDRLLEHLLEAHGVDLPDMTADTLERRLEDESLPSVVKALLWARLDGSRSSSAKYKRALECAVEGVVRGSVLHRGAQRTGRASGRILQPHNFPRPTAKPKVIDAAIEVFKAGAAHLIYTSGGPPQKGVYSVMEMASNMLRGLIIARPGRKLVAADLANIEGRKGAWLAGEQWKLDAFRAYDAKIGPDLYKVAYGRSFGVAPETVGDDSDERQIGKVQELALQYYGGVGAFLAMAAVYGIDLDAMAYRAWPAIPRWLLEQSLEAWHQAHEPRSRTKTYGLAQQTFMVCWSLVRLWRRAHPGITGLWKAIDTGIRSAIAEPGRVFPMGDKLQCMAMYNWLVCALPSGRMLCYPAARVDEDGISYMGVNPYTKQWCRIRSYSGKFFENFTQGSSADVMLDGCALAEENGFRPILTVHDEVVTEPDDDPQFNVEGLVHLMTGPHMQTLYPGLPLSAKGFEHQRYGKR